MFLLKTVVMVLFFNASTPVPYGDAITVSFASRAECEAKSLQSGKRVAKVVADELRRLRARATITAVKNKCEPIGVPA
jgi:hypothetical protein